MARQATPAAAIASPGLLLGFANTPVERADEDAERLRRALGRD